MYLFESDNLFLNSRLIFRRDQELPACLRSEEEDGWYLTEEESEPSCWSESWDGKKKLPKMDFIYKAENGNTPLRNHVVTYHKQELACLTDGHAPHANANPTRHTDKQKRGDGSAGIESYFKTVKRVKKTALKATVFFQLLTLFIVTARLPFRIVLHPIFKALVWFLDPTVPFPTRADITQQYLPALVDNCTSSLKALLQETCGVALTFDLWMSKKTSDILSLDCHFITKDWQWQHVHLGLVAMNGQTAGVVIATKLREILQRFDLKGKLFVAVFDGGANLQTARTELARLHQGEGPACVALHNPGMFFTSCLAHLVNGACNTAVLRVKSHAFEVRHTLS